MIAVSGGGADFQGVRPPVHVGMDGFAGPAGVFLGVVARLAQTCTVGEVCFPSGTPRNHMVDMPDGRITVRHPAGIVAGFNETPKPRREEPGFGVHAQELTRGRRGVKPAKPDTELCIRRSRVIFAGSPRTDYFPSPFGGDYSVALEPGWFAVALEQGPVGHDKVQVDP